MKSHGTPTNQYHQFFRPTQWGEKFQDTVSFRTFFFAVPERLYEVTRRARAWADRTAGVSSSCVWGRTLNAPPASGKVQRRETIPLPKLRETVTLLPGRVPKQKRWHRRQAPRGLLFRRFQGLDTIARSLPALFRQPLVPVTFSALWSSSTRRTRAFTVITPRCAW